MIEYNCKDLKIVFYIKPWHAFIIVNTSVYFLSFQTEKDKPFIFYFGSEICQFTKPYITV